jgi:hypothetical protein
MQELPFFLPGLSGAVIGLIAAFVAARITGTYQVKVANINASRDIQIQRDRIWDERSRAILSAHLQRLSELHITLSEINLENSQTMESIQRSIKSDANMQLSAFTDIYLRNCNKLNKAEAIVAMFYPEMAEDLRKIYGLTNLFWHYKEIVLDIDCQEVAEGNNAYRRFRVDLVETINKLQITIHSLQNSIIYTSKQIQEAFERPFEDVSAS